jgi:hypothetical protein
MPGTGGAIPTQASHRSPAARRSQSSSNRGRHEGVATSAALRRMSRPFGMPKRYDVKSTGISRREPFRISARTSPCRGSPPRGIVRVDRLNPTARPRVSRSSQPNEGSQTESVARFHYHREASSSRPRSAPHLRPVNAHTGLILRHAPSE